MASGTKRTAQALIYSETKGQKRQKRKNAIDWDTYFMGTAFLARHRSKDPKCQVGACIVNDDRIIVGTGYNGFPIGCRDSVFPWNKNTSSPLDCKHTYVCHAEMNAIVLGKASNVKGCTLYVSLFPCNECAKIIIQSGIKKVFYFSDKNSHKEQVLAAKRMFEAAGVKYEQLTPSLSKVEIKFSQDNLADVD